MTALAGLAFARDSDPRAICERLLDAQPAARDVAPRWWESDGIAFGRRLAVTLPEDAFDTGIVTGRGGRLALAADIRLDNRDELLAALGGAEPGLSDAAVAMRAFERWGTFALSRFIGDFALALWDAEAGRLHLARDYLGARPLFLHSGPRGLAFASTAQALTGLAGRRPNRLAALHFLADLPSPKGQSFLDGIERVEPGHMLSIDRHGRRATRFWRPDLTEARYASVDEAVEAFRALLDESVRCRLRGAEGRVAAHLSGGLDSGAVTATAARIIAGTGTVHAFTSVPPPGYRGPAGRTDDEGPAAAAVAALHPAIVHSCVAPPPLSPVDRLDPSFELYGRPMPNLANHVWLAEINHAVRAEGIGVLLTGAMGNLTISHPGGEALGELLRRGRPARALRHGITRRHGGASWRQLAGAAASPWLRRTYADPRGPVLVAPDAARLIRDRPRRSVQMRLAALGRVDGGEFGKAVLAGWGIDVRDPTADRRIAEFCLTLPVEYFAAGGVPRGFARLALADRLPDVTLAAANRARQAGWWHVAARERLHLIRDEIDRIAACPEAVALVDVPQMRRLVEQWPERWPDHATDTHYRMRLLPALALGHFVRRSVE